MLSRAGETLPLGVAAPEFLPAPPRGLPTGLAPGRAHALTTAGDLGLFLSFGFSLPISGLCSQYIFAKLFTSRHRLKCVFTDAAQGPRPGRALQGLTAAQGPRPGRGLELPAKAPSPAVPRL